jgi:hypothetical protein
VTELTNLSSYGSFVWAIAALCVTVACGGDGSADAEETATCPPAAETCATAAPVGELYGDTPNTQPIAGGEARPMFVSMRVREVSFDPRSVSVRGTLSRGGETNYDLFLYVDLETDAPPCQKQPIAAKGGIVEASWPDIYDGSSQDRTAVFEVRYRSGPCGGPWSLLVEGNTSSVTSN